MAKTTLSADFKDLKKQNIKYVKMLQDANDMGYLQSSFTKLDRISACSDYVNFIADETLQHLKVHKGSYCHDPYCPICASRKGYKIALELYTLLNFCLSKKYKAVFLTLTCPNCPGSLLPERIRCLKAAWRKFYRRKDFLSGKCYGCWVSWECTYSEETGFHPHAHVILIVRNSYFNKHNIWTPEDFAREWQACTGLNIATNAIEIETVDNMQRANKLTLNTLQNKKTAKNSFEGLIKYVNDTDLWYLDNPKAFSYMYKAFFGIQRYHYTGCFRQLHKVYKMGLLDDFAPADDVDYVYVVECHYNYSTTSYVIDSLLDLRTNSPPDAAVRQRLDLII